MSKKILAVLLTDTHLKEGNIDINKSVYKQTTQFCKDNGLNTIFHLSDIFNSRKSQSQEVLVDGFCQILDDLGKDEMKLITFPGNHDKTSYSSKKSFLRPFRYYPSFSLYESHTIVEFDGLYVHMIPFFSDVEYLEELRKSRLNLNPNVRHILFTHIGVDGARMNNGETIQGITHDQFDHFEKVFIGHYHDKQVFGEGDKFNYIGSSIQHNFGETPDKGLTVLYDDLSWETVELEFPRFLKIEVDVKKLTTKEINELVTESEKTTDRLKVILVGSEAEVKSVQKKVLQDAGMLVEMKVDSLNKTEIEDRVEPFTSESLKHEFDAFCKKNNLNHVNGLKYLNQVA